MKVLELLESGSVTLIDKDGRLGKNWSNLDRLVDTAVDRQEAVKVLKKAGLVEQG